MRGFCCDKNDGVVLVMSNTPFKNFFVSLGEGVR